MRRGLSVAVAACAAALATAGAANGVDARAATTGGAGPLTMAVIGDTPYGDEQLAQFPALIGDINADPDVRLAVHLGDIKSGSTRCDDAYLETIAAAFDTFEDPLAYTPGDNEWTDCHRPNNGGYDPLERLAALRETFFAHPGRTLGGRSLRVAAQKGVPENQRWTRAGVVFATVHAVGSNNGYAPWTGRTEATPAQRAEADDRVAAARDGIRAAYASATKQGARGVVLMMQADTFEAENETLEGFEPIVAAVGAGAERFARPVLLLQGDTHRYLVDAPVAQAPNLTRVVVEGETADEWLRLTIDPRKPELFSWERVQVREEAGPTLRGRAILPSDAYQPGPPSGALATPDNGVTLPLPGQPIPGFSAVLKAGADQFWAMPDNGFGTKANSGDFLLRLYRIRPDLRTSTGGAGTVEVLRHLQLRDPDGRIPFALTREDRLLTGADFDLESVRRTPDGDFWFGEESGPFLLHTDATGAVLEAPIPLPGVQSPQNPSLPSAEAWNLPASRGFESMALNVQETRLYPILEGALRGDPDPRRRVVNSSTCAAARTPVARGSTGPTPSSRTPSSATPPPSTGTGSW